MRIRHKARTGALAVAALLGGLIVAPAQADINPEAGGVETLTATPLSTWQTNGTVLDIQVVGSVTYVAGNFTSVRPPGAAAGTGEVPRFRLAAFNTATGDLLAWNPAARSPIVSGTRTDTACSQLTPTTFECATVWSLALTPDRTRLVVGGDFQSINGSTRQGVAAFNLPSGALNTTFRPSVRGRVYSVTATNTTAFAGGSFSQASGVSRSALASWRLSDGAFNAGFTPVVTRGTATSGLNNGVRVITLSPDGTRLIVGGGFRSLSGNNIFGLGAVDTSTGAAATWNSNRIATVAQVTNLNVVGDILYSNAESYGTVSEGVMAFDVNTGTEHWFDSCRGASHSSAVVRGVIYVGSHSHDCGVMDGAYPEQYQGYPEGDRRRYTLRAEVPNGRGGAAMLHWTPRTNDGNGAFAMATDDNYLWIGGEFTLVDNKAQQGLTRFTFLDRGGANHKPFTPAAPVVNSTQPGVVDITWKAAEDPDNERLTYEVIRDNNTNNPIHTIDNSARPWALGWMHFRDNVAPGSSHVYDIRATDPRGVRSNRSPQTTVTAVSDYTAADQLPSADGAVVHYAFTGAAPFTSSVGTRTANAGAAVSTEQAGPGVTGTAISLPGTVDGVVIDSLREYSTRQYSVEALFSTTSNTGGSLISFGNSSATNRTSNSNTGNLYLDDAGRLNFGVSPDTTRTDVWANPSGSRQAVTTEGAYNDGQWHHVVGTFEPGTGTRLYVDGVLQASNPALNLSRALNGYLRIGGDRVLGWPNPSTNTWYTGQLDEVAVYRYPLSAGRVAQHAAAMLGQLSAPTGLTAQAASASQIDLTWNAVAGATGYRLTRNGEPLAEVATPAYSDSGLVEGTEYSYTVAALAGTSASAASAPVKASTTTGPLNLLDTGSIWKYNTDGVEPAGWKTPGYDDTAWPSGPSELGHGEDDEATALSPFYTADPTRRRITTYFRTSFEVPSAAAVTSLATQLKRDDGIVLYLNGTEVYRELVPAGALTAETLATTYAGDDGQRWRAISLPASALVDGRNVLTAELHQNARSSLDITFDLRLVANR